jgi:hypothetical protein
MCIHAIMNESEKNTFDWFILLMASIGFYCTVRGTYIVNGPMVGARDVLDRMLQSEYLLLRLTDLLTHTLALTTWNCSEIWVPFVSLLYSRMIENCDIV